jgi:hypothetical protein
VPVCEADPWRYQFFENVPCPPDVRIPTEDADAWEWYAEYRWVYDKLKIAESQGLACAPHGVMPQIWPVFSKPIVNLKGMGAGSRKIGSAAEMGQYFAPGHFWMAFLAGDHVSTDCAVVHGQPQWWRHATGLPFRRGMFDYWTVHAAARPELETYLGQWIARQMRGYTGMMNFETIGGRIIEVHLRFADQWPDLYGPGWVEALIRLYAEKRWRFADDHRTDGFSAALFGKHGHEYRHPDAALVAAVRARPDVSSVQITFHENRAPKDHAMPPGGFRLGLVNSINRDAAFAARRHLAEGYPSDLILWPKGARQYPERTT